MCQSVKSRHTTERPFFYKLVAINFLDRSSGEFFGFMKSRKWIFFLNDRKLILLLIHLSCTYNIEHSISTSWCLLPALPSGPGSGTGPIRLRLRVRPPQPSDRPVLVDRSAGSASTGVLECCPFSHLV